MELGFLHIWGAVGHAGVSQGALRVLESSGMSETAEDRMESRSPMFVLEYLA